MRLIYTDRKLNVIMTSRLLQSPKTRLVGVVQLPAKFNGRQPERSRLTDNESNAIITWSDGNELNLPVRKLNLACHE